MVGGIGKARKVGRQVGEQWVGCMKVAAVCNANACGGQQERQTIEIYTAPRAGG